MTSRSCFGLLLFAAACGGDTSTERTSVDASTTTDVDGSIATNVDAASAVTICDQAKTHSDFAFIQQHVFTPSCATAMCHAGPEPEVGLNLSAGEAYANLVNKGASTVAGWTRVTPGALTTSYLAVSLGRVEGPPPRDGYMPLGADPLCLEKLELIERWILAGAPP
jgi:hypothetical protein